MSQQQIPFTFIDTPEALKKAANEWANENEFGIDLEMENNLHNYGCYTSIIQISSRSKNWIVDTLALKDISSVVKIFEDPSKLKIFHDVTFDFRLLEQEFKCKPRNIFDTEKAAVFLGKESVGLGSLLKEYFDVEKEFINDISIDSVKDTRKFFKFCLFFKTHDIVHCKKFIFYKKKTGKKAWKDTQDIYEHIKQFLQREKAKQKITNLKTIDRLFLSMPEESIYIGLEFIKCAEPLCHY